MRAVCRVTAGSGSGVPEQDGDGPGRVGHHQAPGGQREGVLAATEGLVRPGAAQAEPALQAVGVERPQRDAGLHHRDRQRVVEQALRAQAALEQALERERLDRCALRVGVEADVAEEDAVGPRHRLPAQGHRLGAAEAVRERAQALAHRLGAAAVARRQHDAPQPQLRELLRQLRGDPAGARLRRDWLAQPPSASTRRASALSSSSSKEVPTTRPPRRAKVMVGQTATA